MLEPLASFSPSTLITVENETTSSRNKLETRNSNILREDLFSMNLVDCLKNSKILSEEISKEFDRICKNDPDKMLEIFELFGVQDAKPLNDINYQKKANDGEVFIVAFINDLFDKKLTSSLNSLKSFYQVLEKNTQFTDICKRIVDRQDDIFNEIQIAENKSKSATKMSKKIINLVINMENGGVNILPSSSTSSIRSEPIELDLKAPSTNASACPISNSGLNDLCIVFHKNQIKNHLAVFDYFKAQLQSRNYNLVEIDLSTVSSDQIESKYESTKKKRVLLLYDARLNDTLDESKSSNQDDPTSKLFKKFYNLIYNEYLESNENRRFYLIIMDEFSTYFNRGDNLNTFRPNRVDFNYKWLLKLKEVTENGKKVFSKPIQLFESGNNDLKSFDLKLNSFLRYFEGDIKRNFFSRLT